MKQPLSDTQKIKRYLRHIHPWYFLLLAVIFGVVSVFALRHNNLTMATYRTAVYDADKAGDPARIEQALYNLRYYVVNHMNTSLTSGNDRVYPPIQLKYTYEREQAKQQSGIGQINAALYHDAQQSCEAAHHGEPGAAVIACIENYAASKGVQLSNIPDALYKFDFMSAKWSPDLAGWSIVATVVSLLVFAITAFRRWLRK